MSDDSPLPPVVRTGSLAEQAYWTLRQAIADGSMAPGEAITERGLAASLEVSPTPIREALRKLEHEGLVVRTDARRLRVASQPAESIEELRLVEVGLRALEARFAARKIDDATLDQLRRLVERADAGIDDLSPVQLLALAREFDRAVADAADNPALRRMIESFVILGGDDRDRLDEALVTDPAWKAWRLAQHRELLAALERSDEDASEEVVRRNARSSVPPLTQDARAQAGRAASVDAP